jgi:DNA invertase Pin-like site-specific DNA recombinase
MVALDASTSAIAKAAGVSRQVVYRIKSDPAKSEALLLEWGL